MLVFSEPVQMGGGILEIRDSAGRTIFDNASWTRSADGRRFWADLEPPLVEGETYSLYLTALEDRTGNRMAVAPPMDESFTAPAEDADLTLPLGGDGDILAVIDAPGSLVLISGSPIDPGTLAGATVTAVRSGVQVSGALSLYAPGHGAGGDLQGYENRILLWTPDDPGAYLPAGYTLVIDLPLADPAGHPIHAPPSGLSYTRTGQSDIVWSRPSETPILSASTTGNDRYLHGRPYLPELALYDYRARFYEPTTSTFLELDPIGPADSPNLYQAFGFDGLNVRDPWGECWLTGDDVPCSVYAEEIGRTFLSPSPKASVSRAKATGRFIKYEAIGAGKFVAHTVSAALHPRRTYNQVIEGTANAYLTAERVTRESIQNPAGIPTRVGAAINRVLYKASVADPDQVGEGVGAALAGVAVGGASAKGLSKLRALADFGDLGEAAQRGMGETSVTNPYPKSGQLGRVMPRRHAEAFLRGEGTLSAGSEAFVTAAEDLQGFESVAEVQQRLSLFSDYAGTEPSFSGDAVVTFELKDPLAVGLRSPLETVPARGYGFVEGGRTAGRAREWIINSGTKEEIGAFHTSFRLLRR